jgi:DNA-binding transcriptional MerR regulator
MEDVSIPDKTYYRIGEVSRILNVAPYVVRYWESEFKSVKPTRHD